MTRLRVRLSPTAGELVAGFKRIREQMELPLEFPAAVRAETLGIRALPPGSDRRDARDIDLITIDPPGSLDLDQAFHAERDGSNYVVHYAIADVGAFVSAGSALDREARRRGQTMYCPDARIPLYPKELSEGAASLLPGVDRPAILWSFRLDRDGSLSQVDVTRAIVRSRQQLSYEDAQRAIEEGDPMPSLALLKEIGPRRQDIERERGGIDLDIPEQEVLKVDSGYRLALRALLPVEGWNAQISLLTGMAAAEIMVEGKVGLLRTMPPPEPESLATLRRAAVGLGVSWPESLTYPEFIGALDASRPTDAALLTLVTRSFRGAGYTSFFRTVPPDPAHHAVAAPYAHVTAPLRRVADRFANEVVLSLASGDEPPPWCVAALPELPHAMKDADRRGDELERRILDFVESVILSGRRGETFEAVVVEVGRHGGTVQLSDPAVLAVCEAPLELGDTVRVELAEVDPSRGHVRFVVQSRRLRPSIAPPVGTRPPRA